MNWRPWVRGWVTLAVLTAFVIASWGLVFVLLWWVLV